MANQGKRFEPGKEYDAFTIGGRKRGRNIVATEINNGELVFDKSYDSWKHTEKGRRKIHETNDGVEYILTGNRWNSDRVYANNIGINLMDDL